MDSLSPRPSPFKYKRDPPPWNNRHEDLKRAALSSLDQDLHQWKQGHSAAKRELNHGDACKGSMNFSRLDKARSFAKKEVASRYEAHPENLALSNADRSGDCGSRKLGSAYEKEGCLERGEMHKSSTQKCYGGTLQHDEKQDPMPLSGSEEDVCSGKSSHSKSSGPVAPCHSTSVGTDKPHLKQVAVRDKNASMRSSSLATERSFPKHTVPCGTDASVAPCRSTSLATERPHSKRTAGCDNNTWPDPVRTPTEKEYLVSKDCKRIIKLKARCPETSAEHGRKDVVRSCVKEEKHSVCASKGIVKEEKQFACSPKSISSKSINGSSDELSWKSCSSVKDQKLSPPSSEQVSDRKVLETPVTFLHVARRARSERRRDDSSRSHSSKGVSLDGFGAELEEALLKRQEAEVDSGVQHAAGMQESMVNTGAAASPISTDAASLEQLVCKQQESQIQRSTSLEQTNEREEGELEPEDEVVEKRSLEAVHDVKEDAGDDMQVGSKVNNCGDPATLRVREMHIDHKSILSTDGVNSPDVCVAGTNMISAFTNRKDQGQELNSNCDVHGEDLHGCEGDNGHPNLQHKVGIPSTAMEVNPVHTDLGMSIHQSRSASNVKGFDSSQQMILSLFMRAPETSSEVSKNGSLNINEVSKLCANSGGKQLNGEFQLQMENGARKDSASYLEEDDELSAYDHKQKKLKVGSLHLSLALPGCSTAAEKSASPSLAGHVEHERSFTHLSRQTQSLSQFQTETMSDGFTTSLSLSSFVHNPSCSLNFTSFEDQELSCGGSRQNFLNSGGIHKGPSDINRSVTSLSRDKQKRKAEAPLCPQIPQNGKSHGYAGFSSHSEGNKSWGSNQEAPRYHQIAAFGSAAQISENRGLIQQGRVQKLVNQAQTQPQPQPRVLVESVGEPPSIKPQPQPHVLVESVGEPPSLANKVSNERNKEILGEMKSLSSQKVGLHEISSEPVAAMAQKLQELPDSFLEGLKGLVKELLGSFAKRDEFLALQQVIRRRVDLTEETLLLAHPTQLDILVALKTGMQTFVQQGAKTLTYKALIEIFFETRCRNVDCQQSLPVDGCECKVCSQKKGFCHECMCMVCSKFDSDSNTSRWVGCDLCMHWCHTDCGLRMSHIKSTPVSQRSSEMQFQCLSCDHYMELYGFVKGVFENFAGTWNAETLAKELDCVRRIFHGSEDARGKQLRWKAEEMLQKLENNVAVRDVCRTMLHFFTDGGAQLDKVDHVSPGKAHSQQPNEVLNHNADDGKGGFAKLGSIVARKLSNLVEVYDDKESQGRKMDVVDAQKEGDREGVEQDLHNIIGGKLTDVLMYQARADAAREDATNLQRIIMLKARRMDEDFSLKCARLRLDEAEGRRRKLLEELQALEKSQHDFEKMKVRIESDMKHLMVMSNLQLV